MEIDASGISAEDLALGMKALMEISSTFTKQKDIEEEDTVVTGNPVLERPETENSGLFLAEGDVPAPMLEAPAPLEKDDLTPEEEQEIEAFLLGEFNFREARRTNFAVIRENEDGTRTKFHPDGTKEELPPSKLSLEVTAPLEWAGKMVTIRDIQRYADLYPELTEVNHPSVGEVKVVKERPALDPKFSPYYDVDQLRNDYGLDKLSKDERYKFLQEKVAEDKALWLKEVMLGVLLLIHLDGPQIPDVIWISKHPVLHGTSSTGRQKAVDELLREGYVKYDDEGFLVLVE